MVSKQVSCNLLILPKFIPFIFDLGSFDLEDVEGVADEEEAVEDGMADEGVDDEGVVEDRGAISVSAF